jgi:hypothetical protein
LVLLCIQQDLTQNLKIRTRMVLGVSPLTDFWKDDLLGYKKVGDSFTNLVKTLDGSKVISIEAGFGRGKTFFRKAWSEQLRASDEIVVEIDAQKSDHSGDPLITFVAALVEALPRNEQGQGEKVLETAKKFAAIGGRAVARIALRSVADEFIGAMSDKVSDQLHDFDTLDKVLTNLGDGMSKAAGQMIATQMAAERVRKTELPEQLKALQSALTAGSNTKRVIIIVDELDRCRPTYAIAVLEAMKFVFGQSGFVFCLMVNAEYLERIAQHQFGVSADDEKYLDKFVDLRLRLHPKEDNIKSAVKDLARKLPLVTPFGEGPEFSVEKASELAGDLAVETNLSMRKIKRILLQVELAMRCYPTQPLDAPLLVFLAFTLSFGGLIDSKFLPRVKITPEHGAEMVAKIQSINDGSIKGERDATGKASYELSNFAPELMKLPRDRYHYPDERNYHEWAKVYQFLAPRYIPSHREALGAIADLIV